MCIHITSFNHHVTVVIATCTYDYIYCICIYIYALQFVDMDVENEKMYGCTMVVGPVTFVSFGGLSVRVGSTLASGTQTKNTICSVHVSVTMCDTCHSSTNMDTQTGFFENCIQLTWTFIVIKIFGFLRRPC